MKQPNIALNNPLWIKKIKLKKSSFLTIPLGLGVVFFLLSFSLPNLSNNASLFPFFNGEDSNLGEVTLSVNSSLLEGSTVQEAIFFRMEQIDGVFSNNLNISLTDDNGNLVAICLTDMKDNTGKGVSIGKYFGLEGDDAELNYSKDMGQVTFSNSGSLILEGKNGNSIISRNGWIEIESCENGLLSGSFQFEIGEGEHINTSTGYFKDIEFVVEN